MPITQGDVYVSAPLTNISVGYAQDAANFIADRVFPRVPVAVQGGQYWVWNREDWNRNNMKKRADGTESQGTDLNVSRKNYFASVWALHVDIGDQTRANASSAFALDADTTRYLTTQYLINKEANFTNTYFKTGVWGTDYTGVASGATGNQRIQWSDYTASDPIADIQKAIIRQLLLTGQRPNKLVVGIDVDYVLKNHPDIMDRVKYGGTNAAPSQVNNNALASVFGVEEYLVSAATQNTAEDGAPENNQFFTGKNALLVYAPNAPGLMTPSAGYTFTWSSYLGNAAGGARISKMRIDVRRADRIEAEAAYSQEVVAADMGAYFSNIVA